ncbi:MAG: PKD domain-containing protein, partial [Chitinophagaceae bacterium]
YFDDSLRVEAQVNLVTSIFNNDPWVYWGFSGATGGANNLQQFCTALIPNFTTSIANNVTCLGSPVLFTDSSISFTTIQSFYWDFGDGIFSTVQNPPPHFYATPGNYIVKHVFTGMDGCVSDTIFRTVTIGAIPIANFTVFDTCSGKPARITEQSSCSFGNITEWSWFLDGAPFSNLQQPNLPILPVGTHQLKLFVKSQYGCSSDTITRSFLIKSRPVINFNINNTGCSNQLQNFSANQTDNLTTVQQWNWNFGDGGISVLQNPTYTYTTSGNFIVQLFAMATNGCSSDTLQQPIAIGATPAAAFSVADGCEGAQPNFVNNSSIASGSITQWNWFLNGLPFSTNPIPNLATLPPGNYLLQLIIGSNTGCISDTAFDNFVIKNKPVISSTIPVGGCTQSQLFFSATQTDVATTITQWNWNFGDNQSSTLQNLNHSYTTNGNFTIQVWAVASNGCNSDTTVRLIPINRAIAFAGNDTLVNANSPFQLKGSGGGLYSWAPTTGLNNPTIANPTAILQNDIVYVLTVNVTGCVAMDTVNITVFKGSAIYVPTGFTPNNDNLNDILRPRYVGIKQLSFFSIYNRWGQRIFSTNNMADGWDGTIKGIKQPSGTYVWMLKAEDFTGKIYELKGSTTIIR